MKNKKKILFLSPLPPPHYGSALSSKMCLEILRESRNISVKNIKLNYSKSMRDVGKINLSKIEGISKVKKQIKKQIKDFKPDMVYFVPATSSLGLIRDWLLSREIKKTHKKEILFHIRSRILDKTWNNILGKLILKEMYKDSKAIILGKELIRDLRRIIPEKDISILPNAIKNEISESKLKKIINKRKQNKHLNILFLSNMDSTKGWPKLLDACKILNEINFNFKCDFVGEWANNSDKQYFLNFIKKNNLTKKVFSHGKKIGSEKNKFLENANVLVFPTDYPLETFGRVILESYMYEVPVIANGIATIPTIIKDKETGFILEKNNGEEIAKIIIKEKKWEKMGIEGRKRFLSNYELKKYKTNFLKIIIGH
ncbi:MAG: glycosyltransferase [Nanoarchaeota archaeon]|nr:glycosyltransferase [Nanoarchaeota archaeon]